MMNMIMDFVSSRTGTTLIAATLFVTGLGWAGWFSGFTDWVGGLGFGAFNVANLFGVTALLAGGALLLAEVGPAVEDMV